MSFPSHYARTYQLAFTPDLVDAAWSNLPPPRTGIGGLMTLYHTNGAPQGFYRIQVSTP